MWARYAGQMLVVTPFAWHRAGPGFWRTRRLGLQLLRSALLLCATFCFFGALRYLPLAEASAITFLAPVFVVVLSGPMLGERPGRARWIAAIVGFVGILILLRPGSAVFHPAALLLLLAALSNALYPAHAQAADESAHTTLFYSALVGTVGLIAGAAVGDRRRHADVGTPCCSCCWRFRRPRPLVSSSAPFSARPRRC